MHFTNTYTTQTKIMLNADQTKCKLVQGNELNSRLFYFLIFRMKTRNYFLTQYYFDRFLTEQMLSYIKYQNEII